MLFLVFNLTSWTNHFWILIWSVYNVILCMMLVTITSLDICWVILEFKSVWNLKLSCYLSFKYTHTHTHTHILTCWFHSWLVRWLNCWCCWWLLIRLQWWGCWGFYWRNYWAKVIEYKEILHQYTLRIAQIHVLCLTILRKFSSVCIYILLKLCDKKQDMSSHFGLSYFISDEEIFFCDLW